MRIALCSTIVPFIGGGGRAFVEWLDEVLRAEGHDVEIVYLPQTGAHQTIVQQMEAFRWINLDSADRIICIRPQAHLIPHRNKVLWFIHHLRQFYDLWDTPYRGMPDDEEHRALREYIFATDDAGLREAKSVFTNSRVVSDRLLQFNGVFGETLFPPVHQPERFYCSSYGDEVLYIARVEHHKRQHLLVEAMQYTKSPVRLRLVGLSSDPGYAASLSQQIAAAGLADRVGFENRWVSEDEKADLLADCLAAAYLPLDEDSYGYPTLEAAHARKPTLTTSDSGGVLEFVTDGVNGRVTAPDPAALGAALDDLFQDRVHTKEMGGAAESRITELGVSWSHVLERLLA